MSNLKMRTKILFGFGAIIILATLIGIIGYIGISQINYQIEIGNIANRILVDAQDAQAHSLRYIIYGDRKYQEQLKTELQNVFDLADQAEKLMLSEANRKNTQDLKDATAAYQMNNLEYFNIDAEKLASGAVRVEKAAIIVNEIIEVVTAAKEFSLSTTTTIGGRTFLEKSSVDRVWLMQEARNATNRFRIWAQKYQIAVNPDEQDEIAENWMFEIANVRNYLTKGLSIMRSDATKKAITEGLSALKDYEKQVLQFRQQNRDLRDVQARQRQNAGMVMEKARLVRDGVIAAVKNATDQAYLMIVVLISLTLIAALIIAFIITRIIFKSLGCEPTQIQEISSQIASGNLLFDFEDKKLIGAYASMQEMVVKLTSMIEEIKSKTLKLSDMGLSLSTNSEETNASVSLVSKNITSINKAIEDQNKNVDDATSAISQISANIDGLNHSISSQASQVLESSSAVQEMVSSIHSVSENMKKVAQSNEELLRTTQDGYNKMQDSNNQIMKISEESQKLMETNQLISNIASQTNLLAMNAAIEAAHAGDAGRGFSVVADEIRKLAESTSQQSQEVSSMLEHIEGLIENIVTSSKETVDSFENMQHMVQIVNERSEEINNAMMEQSTGGQQILESLSSMTEVTELVKKGASEIASGSNLVLLEMEKLKKSSENNKERVNDITSNTEEISHAVEDVMKASISNKEMVDSINAEMSFFETRKDEPRVE